MYLINTYFSLCLFIPDENLAIQALTEINGTIVCGRPIIAQFGRNTNRVQRHER